MSDFLMKFSYAMSQVCRIYSFILLARVCMSWIIRDPSVWSTNGLVKFICAITDPFLNLFRPKNPKPGARVDFSPLFAFMVLSALETMFSLIADYGHITVWLAIAVLIQTLWVYIVRYILIIITVACGIRVLLSWSVNPRTIAFRNIIDRMINRPVCAVWNFFCPKKAYNDRKMVILAFISYLAVFLGLRYGVSVLVNWLATL